MLRARKHAMKLPTPANAMRLSIHVSTDCLITAYACIAMLRPSYPAAHNLVPAQR